MAGYYEEITHNRFGLSNLLHKMGAMDHPLAVPKGKLYVALNHERIKIIAKTLHISDEELASSTENVIWWCLSKGYKVEGVNSTFCASSSIDLIQARELAETYLPIEKQRDLMSLFREAKLNMQDGEKIPFGSVFIKSRV